MNKILTIGAFCLISASSFAVLQPGKVVKNSSSIYYLKSNLDSLALIDDFSAVNSTVEFDLLPQNSSAQVGVLLRYVNEND